MARRYSSYRRARRTFRAGSYRARRGSKGGFGNYHMKWGVGAVAGMIAPQLHPMQDMLITAAAVAPIRLPYGIKTFAQGYVGGKILKPFIGGFANTSSVSNTDGSFV